MRAEGGAVYALAVLVAAICLPARIAGAQASGCTYDGCALRLQSRFFAQYVVQGVDATPVGRLGLFAPHLEPVSTAGDSARVHYEAFRIQQNRGGALSLVGTACAVTATIIWASDDDFPYNRPTGTVWALLGVGLTFSIAGHINITKGRDHLHQAIWFYNRSLPTVP